MLKTPKSKTSGAKPKKKIILKSPGAASRKTSQTSGKTGLVTAAGVSFVEVSLDEKHRLISTAAYYRAEQRSFAPGRELEDWLDAEAEIERILSPNDASRQQ